MNQLVSIVNIYVILGGALAAASFIIIAALIIKNRKLSKRARFLAASLLTVQDMVNSARKDEKDNDVHKENFIKFISDSRDWAFEYIEEFQAGLDEFVSSVEPEINYFKEYGDLMSMSPNYYSLKKIVEEYEKLKKLLPKKEEQE